MKAYLLIAVVTAALLVQAPNESHANYVLDRTPIQGKTWMSWSEPERERFLLGYLQAYHLGFTSACRNYFEGAPPKTLTSLETSPLQKCMLQELHYSASVTQYERQITDFYNRFPDAHEEPLSWLIQAFSDSERKTPEEIHAAWSRGHAHP